MTAILHVTPQEFADLQAFALVCAPDPDAAHDERAWVDGVTGIPRGAIPLQAYRVVVRDVPAIPWPGIPRVVA